jgi:acetylornithine/N-succinyldiaminopimelate aminotransferase
MGPASRWNAIAWFWAGRYYCLFFDGEGTMADDHLMATYNRRPPGFEHGAGVWLYDARGRAWLDSVSGIAVCNLGHAHPAVTGALCDQAQRLMHTSNLYPIAAQEQLAERLCQHGRMDRVFFCNSGSEANEAAMKLARKHGHERGLSAPKIVVMDNAFHGRTLASLAATGNASAQAGFDPLPEGFVRVPFNDLDAVAALGTEDDIAAVLVEPVQGEGGVRIPDADYLAGLRRLCDRHGWLLMLDEVQTGNGRTGRYFACEHAGVVPDVIATAKGLGNGFPIGACLARGEAADVLGPGSHGTTFGGNPLACATALAVVQQLEEVMPGVEAQGEQLRSLLAQRLAGNDLVRDVRGLGLMCALELDRGCSELVGLCHDRHLLANVTANQVVRLVPPLIINDHELTLLADRLGDALHAFTRQQEAA